MKKQPTVEARSTSIFRNTPETLRYFYHPDHIGSTSWVTDSAKNGIQYCEYLPVKKLRFFSSLAFGNVKQVFHYAHCLCRFGEPFIDQRSTTWNSRYTFSGKERDNETGYSYFGARYYNSDISIWLSVDPLSDKYPNLTAYAYCGNNPIILVDPDGKELVITGDDAADATQQLENQTSKKFNIVRHEDGTVSYEGKARTRADRYIKKVIDDENITVNIVAKNSTNFKAHDGTEYTYETDEEGNIGGGAYGGSTVSEDGQVNAYQYINPEKLGILDGKVGDKKTGGYMLHEVAEGYESGKIAYRKGTGDNVGGPRYNTAHQRANKISGGGWLILKYTRDRMDIKTGRVWQEVYKKEYIRSNN